jgi:fucose 4-O-acetylase-like acetyltransferase
MDERPATPTPDEESQVVDVVRRASRFSREFLATMIALVTTAFGVVVALAWNTALSKALAQLSKVYQITGLFTYAIVVTVVAVLTVMALGRLAARIGAEPIEFKYPAPGQKKE